MGQTGQTPNIEDTKRKLDDLGQRISAAKSSLGDQTFAAGTLPFAVLMVVALIAGGLAFALARRYPSTAAAEAPARAASGKLAEEAEHRPWLSDILRTRLDPSTATGMGSCSAREPAWWWSRARRTPSPAARPSSASWWELP